MFKYEQNKIWLHAILCLSEDIQKLVTQKADYKSLPLVGQQTLTGRRKSEFI